MAVSSIAFLGLMEIVMLFSGGGILGMPPGERDALLLKTAPESTLIYLEWASRGEGKVGAPGVDGFVADPEIQEFTKQVIDVILNSIATESQNGPPEAQVMGKALPPLLLELIRHPGCLYVTFDQEAAARAIENVGPMQGPNAYLFGVQATLIINGGEQADEIAEHLSQLTALLPADSIEQNLQFQKLPVPMPYENAPELVLHRHQDYFILGFGKDTVKNAVAGLDGKQKTSLADNDRMTEALQKLSMERVGGIFWLDIAKLKATAAETLGPDGEAMVMGAMQLLGADSIDSLVSVSGVVKGKIASQSFLTTGGTTEGVLSLVGGRGLKAEDFEHVPADADFLYAFSLNLPKVYQAANTIIERADPQAKEVFEGDIKQLEEEFGITLENLFAALGEVWTVHNAPSTGGVFITSMVAGVEVKDREKAEQFFHQLMVVIGKLVPGDMEPGYRRRRGVYLESSKFMDHTIYYINTVGGEMPFAPAFCLTETHILAALHPQALKAQIRFGANEQRETLVDKMQDRLAEDAETIAYSYFDAKGMFQTFYTFAPYFGGVAFGGMQGQGIDLKPISLPSASAFLPYMSFSESRVIRTKQGIRIESESGLPIPGGLNPMMMVVPMFGLVGFRTIEAPPAAIRAVPAQGFVPAPLPARQRVIIQAVPAQAIPIQIQEAVPDQPIEIEIQLEKKAVPADKKPAPAERKVAP